MKKMCGKISKIIYENETFQVFEIEVSASEVLVASGNFLELQRSIVYDFEGAMAEHKKYGMQYVVSKATVKKPEKLDEIITFLASSIFEGIGKKSAEVIVDYLQEDTLDVIKNDLDRLKSVPKMTGKRAVYLQKRLLELDSSENIFLSLQSLGLSQKNITKLYLKYKDKAFEKIKENPYILIDDLDNFAFKRSDQIASKLDEDYSKKRLEAFILYIFKTHLFKLGHTYLKKEQLFYLFNEYQLNYSVEEIEKCLHLLITKQKIIFDIDYFYPASYLAEKNIALKLESKKVVDCKFHLNTNNQLSKKQNEAISEVFKNPVTIITGGPGTGKTTLLKELVFNFKKK